MVLSILSIDLLYILLSMRLNALNVRSFLKGDLRFTLDTKEENLQTLIIKDIYCVEGLSLEPALACFYSFLIFNSEKFIHNNKGIKPYIGYSDKSLTEMYRLKWFKVCKRTVQYYLQELKNKELIIIKNEGKASRKIYINYAKIQPELLSSINNTIEEEYKIKIKSLKKELEEVKKAK